MSAAISKMIDKAKPVFAHHHHNKEDNDNQTNQEREKASVETLPIAPTDSEPRRASDVTLPPPTPTKESPGKEDPLTTPPKTPGSSFAGKEPKNYSVHSQNNPESKEKDDSKEICELKLEDFNIERTVGTGSFGRVHLIQSKINNRYYALKVLKKEEVVKLKQVEHTNNERATLASIQHPFIVNLWGSFQDDAHLFMQR
ncbi:hypothetical protein G6F56_011975 [Rhizopus delemar]|nr:hypothetical protein G6F56_011975 [Rhizopus delemar]